MPSIHLAPAWQRPCGHLTAQHSTNWTGPSSSLRAVRAACRYPGGHSAAGSINSGGGRCCKRGFGAGTPRLHSRSLFTSGSHGAATSAAAQPSTSSGGSGSSPAQPCPLHACLLRYGITDLAAFSAPRHLTLSQETVDSNVEPKLAALAAEGLSPRQMAQLLGRKTRSALSCSYTNAFLPNLQLLQEIAAHADYRPHPKQPRLTAAGKMLTDSPADTAIYLSRSPDKVQELLQWLEGSLGLRLEQLAACKSLSSMLRLSAAAASAVCTSLQAQQVPAGQVAHMLYRQPTLFNHRPEVLSARLGALQQNLGLDAAAALQVAMAHPRLLTLRLEASLPPLLRFLDGYMGEEGAGRRLVCAKPSLASTTAEAAEHSTRNLAARGYSQHQIRGMIRKQPTILALDLDSPLQQQKLDWIERVSPWTLDDFMVTPAYFAAATWRLAARLALLRECGLPSPPTPGVPAIYSDPRFMETVNNQRRKLP
ncbi:hypothetical protein N2152v2_009966 [Parachlorella kessleri]